MSANESRRRGYPPSQQKDGKPITIPFRYQALEDNVYATRFVQIETAESNDSLLVCSLTHVAFGDRPKFEALSYMWGGEDEQRAITLNGCQFHVRKNLFDALVYLRSQGQTGFLWVDALCIDQNNIKERTKQVRIMRHIYFRAASVVVWLGSKYSRYQKSLTEIEVSNIVNPTSKPEEEIPDAAGDRGEETQTEASKVEREMVRQLVADEYWNRVWIIQEVGQNEMKRVCFGHMEVGWDDFIHLVTMHNAKGGPLRLAQQLSQKYAGAHTLRRLLIDHKDAQCKEPRDKIYGLVGLALDACGFPLDYEKSLLVVWNDTMEFMNRHGLFLTDRETDIIYIGGLVKSLLMGAKCSPFQQIAQQAEPQTDLQIIEAGNYRETSNPKVFYIKAYVLGCIRIIMAPILATPRRRATN
ncbi:Heterokaryon incompatibility protein 6, OR allele [Colletotrichum higginsianum]|uniref:Heterokaryon incompatibility protein 6, OR allele n=1 Tax=Colletotrichum higginsianum TaxID=80884 RepID=A0A4T0VHI7_9PEZI|nr:Heterokaryon incompatibility protein 6, OR allele [Colletotrichum higginsianum]